jgi:hypothetical protein
MFSWIAGIDHSDPRSTVHRPFIFEYLLGYVGDEGCWCGGRRTAREEGLEPGEGLWNGHSYLRLEMAESKTSE